MEAPYRSRQAASLVCGLLLAAGSQGDRALRLAAPVSGQVAEFAVALVHIGLGSRQGSHSTSIAQVT